MVKHSLKLAAWQFKAASVELSGFASSLYSSSKLMRLITSITGLRRAVRQIIAMKIEVRFEPVPEDGGHFLKVAMLALALDGDSGLLWTTNKKGTKKETALYHDLVALDKICRYDAATDRWAYYAWAEEARAARTRDGQLLASVDMDQAVDEVSTLVTNIFLGTSWQIASLSRWTHVMEGMKRLALGCAMGGIIPAAFAALPAQMGLAEEKVKKDLEEALAKEARGEESNVGWLKHCARVGKVALFWNQPAQQVRLIISLKSSVVADELHWCFVGKKNMGRANLTSLVDPVDSAIGKSLARICALLSDWGPASPEWELLTYMRQDGWEVDQDVCLFTRRQLVRLSCGIFRRFEQRFSVDLYRCQWLISDHVPADEKRKVVDAIARRQENTHRDKIRYWVPILTHWGTQL